MKLNNLLRFVLILCVEGVAIGLIWNGLTPTTHLPELTMGQAIGVLVALRIVLRPLWLDTNMTLSRIEDFLFFQIQMKSVQMTKPEEVKPDKSEQ